MHNEIKTSTKKDLEKFIENKSFKKIFLIAGNTSFVESGLNLFFNIFKKKNIKVFFKKKSIPEYEELLSIIYEINKFNPDLIIAAGGGSVLDYAKIANVLFVSTSLKDDISNSKYKLVKHNRKLLAIPTTAGSGAEVTANAVIYVNKIKYSIEGELIKPDFYFLIPDFVKGASNKIKSSAGFDAISQAIESLISKKSTNESVSYSVDSLKISLKYFHSFLNNPNNENTCAMLCASNLAGKAISISKTTAPHAVSYPFTSIFNISHGHAVSLTFNKFINFNFKNIQRADCNFNLHDRYKILFNLTNTSNINELISYLNKILSNARLENNFKKLGIDINQSLEKILSQVNDQRLLNNPVKIDKENLKLILLEEQIQK